MRQNLKKTVTRVNKANQCACRACWWLKDIDRDTLDSLDISRKIDDLLELLRKADDISMDIQITLINKTQQQCRQNLSKK